MLTAAEQDQFFLRLASNCHYLPENIIRQVYYGLLKTIIVDLVRKKQIEMPDFGSLKVVEQAPRRISNVNTGEKQVIIPSGVIKYTPYSGFKKIVKEKIG